MKKQCAVFFLVTFSFNTIQEISAQSQREMNTTAIDGNKAAKAELQGTINRIFAMYSKEADFIAAFKDSNDAWERYVVAQLKMKFPAKNTKLEYGSVFPMCYSLYAEELIRNRIKELRLWAGGVQEGDVCCGSVHFKNN